MEPMIDETEEAAKRLEIFADAFESAGPLALVLGPLVAVCGLPWFGVGLVVSATAAIFGAALLRERATARRDAAAARHEAQRALEAERLRLRALDMSFIVTDERLTTLRGVGGGRDLILALRRTRKTRLKIAGDRLLPQLEQRLGSRRTVDSLPLVVEYLVDRRKEART